MRHSASQTFVGLPLAGPAGAAHVHHIDDWQHWLFCLWQTVTKRWIHCVWKSSL